jgi:AcrR family transcriptional regulator
MSSMTVARPYRGVSAADRTQVRRARLIEGFLDVVLEEGALNATVDKVCGAAGLTKRYFYESFNDLDQLMLAAADEMFGALYDEMVANAETHSGPAESRLRAVVSAVVTRLASDPRRARLYAEAPGHPALRARRTQAVEAFTTFVNSAVLSPEGDSLQRTLKVYLVVAGATDLITARLDGSLSITEDDIVDAIVDLALTL